MKKLLLGTSVFAMLCLSSCSYNDRFDPWFDENRPLYEHNVKKVTDTENTNETAIVSATQPDEDEETPKDVATKAEPLNPDDPANEASLNTTEPSKMEDTEKVKDEQNINNINKQAPVTKTEAAILDYDSEPELEMIPDDTIAQINTTPADKGENAKPKPKFEPLVAKPAASIPAPSVSFAAAYIPYAKGSYNLDNKDTAGIVDAVKLCNEYNCTLRIVTHTMHNNPGWQQLSQKRINNIKQKIIKNGIAGDRIIIDANNPDGNFAEIFIEY